MILPLVVSALLSTVAQAAALSGEGEVPAPDATLQRIEDKFGNNAKRYDKLAKQIRASVEDALDKTAWGDPEAGATLASHSHVEFVKSLNEEALARSKRRKNSPEVVELLKKYPWQPLLELPRGLEFGSDRPIPPNTDGFIKLETPAEPLPGYPELHVNYYLWGTGEIASWQTGTKKGKPKYLGRESKDVIHPAEALPSHEAIRVYLTGNLPETPLLAIPELQHRIHSRLMEKRSEALGKRHPMDELLALFASKYNGFEFVPVYDKKEMVITVPLHSLLADMQSFPFHFRNSEALKSVGDLPFTAIQTYQEYSVAICGEEIGTGPLIAENEAGKACLDEFRRDTIYLQRYKSMVDLMVRSLLSPEIPFPAYLRIYDYPAGEDHAPPAQRTAGSVYDVTRRQALLLWAACEKDPVCVADWLHEHVLSKEGNMMPTEISPTIAMLQAVRAQEQELLQKVVATIAKEREARGDAPGPGPFESEFSPYETYLSIDGGPNGNALANSFHQFHAQLAGAIAAAAFETVHSKVK